MIVTPNNEERRDGYRLKLQGGVGRWERFEKETVKVQTSSLLPCPPIRIVLSWVCSAPNCLGVYRVATVLAHPLAFWIVIAWGPWGPFLEHSMRSSYGAQWCNTSTCQCLKCEHAVQFNLSPVNQYNHSRFLASLLVVETHPMVKGCPNSWWHYPSNTSVQQCNTSQKTG